jgi:hypothetical protein
MTMRWEVIIPLAIAVALFVLEVMWWNKIIRNDLTYPSGNRSGK